MKKTLALSLAWMLTCATAAFASGFGVPDFNQLKADKPTLDAYPSFVQARGLMLDQKTDQPLFEYAVRAGYRLDGKGGATFDPAISKLQLVTDIKGYEYSGIAQLVDGQPFTLIKKEDAGEYWLHGILADGSYRAAVCKEYDLTKGLVSNCRKTNPVLEKNAVAGFVGIAQKMSANTIEKAIQMGAFKGVVNTKPDETQTFIDLQRQNFRQLTQ